MQAAAEAGAKPAGLSSQTRLVAWIVSAIFFIEQLDATILAPALPSMAADLNSDPISLSAAITAYLLGLTVLIPLSGRLADRHGDRTVFSAAIIGFLASSVACGFAQDATVLIALRFVQGLAGALMAPVGRLIVLRTAARHELVEAMALVIMLAMIAPMVGPFLGGVLTTYLGWRWVFWINAPLCIISLCLVWRYLPLTPGKRSAPIDLIGSVLTGAGFSALVFGLMLLGESHDATTSKTTAVGSLAAGVALLALYGWHARRIAEPVLAVSLLRLRSFRDAMAGGSIFRIAVGGVPFLLPLTLQEGYRYSALAAGMVVLVPAAGGFAMKFFSTRILRRLGYRHSLFVHGLAAGCCLALAGVLDPGEAMIVYVLTLFGFGWSRSLQMNAYGTLAYADVDKARLASATSFFLAIQNLTVALGVALAAILLRGFHSVAGLDPLHGHMWTYVVLGVIAVVSSLLCLAWPAATGQQLLAQKKS